MRLLGLLVLVVCELAAYLAFCRGFFPTKVLLTPEEIAQFGTSPPKGYTDPPRQFDRVVFMLVDAMRADFVLSEDSSMPFTQSLLNQGYALGFTAFSNPPTVTLPRLKGITTGSIPNFIDAVLNIAEDDTSSSLGDQDSWVKQMHLAGWKIHMFGDDTWLKLFPGYFDKTDGTSSFYVSDYTIVDHNVTRHLTEQLDPKAATGVDSWNTMILHYLGMDHIGHKGGAHSANMPAKQMELDMVVQRIFSSLLQHDPSTLMVLIGDHGMNDAGNHGGSSVGEVSSGMVLISSRFQKEGLGNEKKVPLPVDPDFNYLRKVDQIDLVPTLAELCGLNVPINNLGTFLEPLLALYSPKQRLNVLVKNALQLKVLLDKAQGKRGNPLEEECDVQSEKSLLEYISKAKSDLSEASSDYNYDFLHLGMALYAILTVVALVVFALHYKKYPWVALADFAFFTLYSLSFLGSSTIEEEHHLWWFFTLLMVVYLVYLSIQKGSYGFFSTFFLLIFLRILKGWNNSGQKYNSTVFLKISTYIQSLPVQSGPAVFATLLFVNLFLFLFVKVQQRVGQSQTIDNFLEFVLLCTMACILFAIKMLSYLTSTFDLDSGYAGLSDLWIGFITWLQTYSRGGSFTAINNELYRLFQYLWIVFIVAVTLKPRLFRLVGWQGSATDYANNIQIGFAFLALSQTNFINAPLFIVLYYIFVALSSLLPKNLYGIRLTNILSLATLLLQNLSFFQFGSTNSLASVDLTNSFNGLTSYNVLLTGVLCFVSNWAAPIFWSVSYTAFSLLSLPAGSVHRYKWNCLYDRMVFNLAFYSVAGLLLMGSCYNLRFHLFIWTVFSPKLLYFLAWIGSNLLVDFGLNSLLTAMYVE